MYFCFSGEGDDGEGDLDDAPVIRPTSSTTPDKKYDLECDPDKPKKKKKKKKK